MPTWYCHANEPKSGWQSIGVLGIRGFTDMPGGPRLPNNLPNVRGNFNSRNWFTADAYASYVGMSSAEATAYLDAGVARGVVNTGTW